MTERKIENVGPVTGIVKGAPARPVTVTQSAPSREGAPAPQVAAPPNLPSTNGPVSVTKPKA
jgi:hypothetical protein